MAVLGGGFLIDYADDAGLPVECLRTGDVHRPSEVIAFLDQSPECEVPAPEVLGEVVDLTLAGGFTRDVRSLDDVDVRGELVVGFDLLLGLEEDLVTGDAIHDVLLVHEHHVLREMREYCVGESHRIVVREDHLHRIGREENLPPCGCRQDLLFHE